MAPRTHTYLFVLFCTPGTSRVGELEPPDLPAAVIQILLGEAHSALDCRSGQHAFYFCTVATYTQAPADRICVPLSSHLLQFWSGCEAGSFLQLSDLRLQLPWCLTLILWLLQLQPAIPVPLLAPISASDIKSSF